MVHVILAHSVTGQRRVVTLGRKSSSGLLLFVCLLSSIAFVVSQNSYYHFVLVCMEADEALGWLSEEAVSEEPELRVTGACWWGAT